MADQLEVDLIVNAIAQGFEKIEAGLTQGATASDKLTTGLTSTEKAITGARTTIGGLSKDITLFGANIGSAADMMHNLGINIPTTPAAAFGMVLKDVDNFVKDSIKDTLALDDSVRTLSSSTGDTAEESSRLIAVFGKYGVGADQLQRVLAYAVKKGFDPTIEGVAKLSDDLSSMTDVNERAKDMADVFGKSWASVSDLMLKGSDNFKTETDAVNQNLIRTQDSIDASQKYEFALHDLNEQVEGLKVSIGTGLLPVLADFITAINTANGVGDQEAVNMATDAGEARRLGISYWEARGRRLELEREQNRAIPVIQAETSSITDSVIAHEHSVEALDEARAGYVNLAERIPIATTAMNNYATAAELAATAAGKLKDSQNDLASAESNLKTDTQKLNDELGNMSASAIETSNKSYDKRLAAMKISDQVFGTHAALTMEKTKEVNDADTAFLNSPQKEADKAAYLQRLDDIKAKYAETDDAINADELKIQELQGVIASLTGTTVYIDTVHRDIYDPTHYTGTGGSTVTTPKPHVGPGGQALGGPFSTSAFINESPATRPETVIYNPTGGYVLTKQDAQAALAGKAGGGRGATITQNFYVTNPLAAKMMMEQARRDKLAAIEGRL